MPVVRHTLLIRALAAVLVLSTSMLSMAPAMGYQGRHVSYAEWLSGQLQAPAGGVVQESLDELRTERHHSVAAFLDAFVSTIEAKGEDAGSIFGVEHLSGGYLVSYLESRYANLTAEAIPVRTYLTVASATVGSTDRGDAAAANTSAAPELSAMRSQDAAGVETAASHPRRVLITRQPRAP